MKLKEFYYEKEDVETIIEDLDIFSAPIRLKEITIVYENGTEHFQIGNDTKVTFSFSAEG